MIADLFPRLLFGHLFGDYLFQNDWMALNKKEKLLPCLVHCLIYTLTICIFLPKIFFNPILFIWVFQSHFVLDKYGFVERYLESIRGRTWSKAIDEYKGGSVSDTAYISFTAIVQTVVDNTLHLFLMWIML